MTTILDRVISLLSASLLLIEDLVELASKNIYNQMD